MFMSLDSDHKMHYNEAFHYLLERVCYEELLDAIADESDDDADVILIHPVDIRKAA